MEVIKVKSFYYISLKVNGKNYKIFDGQSQIKVEDFLNYLKTNQDPDFYENCGHKTIILNPNYEDDSIVVYVIWIIWLIILALSIFVLILIKLKSKYRKELLIQVIDSSSNEQLLIDE